MATPMRCAQWLLAAGLLIALAGSATAQSRPTGHVSLFFDYLPNRQDTIEWRSRIFVEEKIAPSPSLRITLSGFAEGLLSRRPVPEVNGREAGTTRVTDGIFRVQDANVELTKGKLDVLAGFARVVWGKLDELQPSDVINPLDVSKFFFEGRNEARLPVALVRARVFIHDDLTVEGIYVPAFRRGRFDQLDEPTSPFNLAAGVDAARAEPALTFENTQGGLRISSTAARVDWSVSAYRGFEPFGFFNAVPALPGIQESHPRFTMLASDFEAVFGEWGIRGEVAAFVDDNFQSTDGRVVEGQSVDAGAGIDRRAGRYTLSFTVLYHHESYDEMLVAANGPSRRRSDVSLIASTDRTFAREKYRTRVFAVYNPTETSAFIRGILTASLRDNLSLEGSLGWFISSGRDLVGRFSDDDFAYARLKYYF
jgi:hypothetical protein